MGAVLEIINTLGPFQSFLLDIEPGTEEFEEIDRLVDLCAMPIKDSVCTINNDIGVKLTVYRREEAFWDACITKRVEGILGIGI